VQATDDKKVEASGVEESDSITNIFVAHILL